MRSLLEVADLPQVPGGGWLAIGIVCGFALGLIVGAVAMLMYVKRQDKAQPVLRDVTSPRPPSPPGPLVSPFAHANMGGNRLGRLASPAQPAARSPPAATPPAPMPPPVAMAPAHKQTEPDAPPLGLAQPPELLSPLAASMQTSRTAVRGSQASATDSFNPEALGGHGVAVLKIERPAPSQEAGSGIASPLAGEGPVGSATSARPQPPVEQQHSSGIATEYHDEDLDQEWLVLLGDLDRALVGQRGLPPLTPQERAVAVRRLIALTGSRGLDAALGAALDDVLRFRSSRAAAAGAGAGK